MDVEVQGLDDGLVEEVEADMTVEEVHGIGIGFYGNQSRQDFFSSSNDSGAINKQLSKETGFKMVQKDGNNQDKFVSHE